MAVGAVLVKHKAVVDRVLGALTVLLGLSLLGMVPAMRREFLVHRRMPNAGLTGAPMLGVIFGVGWLTAAYCLGLGVPFLLTAVALRRALAVFVVVRRHAAVVMRVSVGRCVLVGLLPVSGLLTELINQMRGWIAGYSTAL